MTRPPLHAALVNRPEMMSQLEMGPDLEIVEGVVTIAALMNLALATVRSSSEDATLTTKGADSAYDKAV